MKTIYLSLVLLLCKFSFSQDIKKNLNDAINKLLADAQFKHSIISIYIADSNTGKTIYEKNADLGLAPASCQKIITSASAFELLGNNFRYGTDIGYYGDKHAKKLTLYFTGNGDPSLGSFRFASTKEPVFMDHLKKEILAAGIEKLNGIRFIDSSHSFRQTIPAGWVWEDIGNYYGAAPSYLNWNENQYYIFLNPGNKAGDSTSIQKILPAYTDLKFYNLCKTGPEKSGDHAYIYFGLNSAMNMISGTIPLGENNFSISGAVPDPPQFFHDALSYYFKENLVDPHNDSYPESFQNKTLLYTYYSPSLDSLNYWFLKKSINLYGEAFVKSIAAKLTNISSTDSGINVIRDFWSKHSIERSALKIIDGSGLSPANRVTTHALVQVLQHAKSQSWFSSFYNALPEMNNIKMKDGYIGGVRSYAGYLSAKNGAAYTFAFIVNNFDGSPATAREKIWHVLDLLK